MIAEQARAILAEAKKKVPGEQEAIYEGPIPEDDAKAISEAEDLVEMAKQAWDQYVRGPAIEALLNLAKQEFEPQNGNGNGHAEPEPEKPEETKTPELAEPLSHEEIDMEQDEPWPGYDNEGVHEVISGINAAPDDISDREDLRFFLAHVWSYESAHRARTTILNRLNIIGGRIDREEQHEREAAEREKEKNLEVFAKEEPKDEVVPVADPETIEEDSPTPAPEVPETPPEPVPEPEPEIIEPEKAVETEKPRDTPETQESDDQVIADVERQMKQEFLHIPKPPEAEIPDLPYDWTTLSAQQLQRFYGIYSAAAYYKGWQTSRDERLAQHWRDAANELHNELLRAADKYDAKGKAITLTLLEAEIESDEHVKKFRRRQRFHEARAAVHRRERDSMNRLVDSLSRLESMKDGEYNRSGQRGSRR